MSGLQSPRRRPRTQRALELGTPSVGELKRFVSLTQAVTGTSAPADSICAMIQSNPSSGPVGIAAGLACGFGDGGMESIYRSIQAGTPGAAEARDGLRGLLRRAERWQDLASLLERCIEEEAEEGEPLLRWSSMPNSPSRP